MDTTNSVKELPHASKPVTTSFPYGLCAAVIA